MEKFPEYWTPPMNYRNALKDLEQYISQLKDTIANGNKDYKPLEIMTVSIQNISYEAYSSNAVKKLLNFNNY